MEDSVVLNKASFERGFGHASVYKTKVIDLAEEKKRSAKPGAGSGGGTLKFSNFTSKSKLHPKQGAKNDGEEGDEEEGGLGASRGAADEQVAVYDSLDDDGLPHVGDLVREGEPLVCIVDELTGAASAVKHKEAEPAFVQSVRALGTGTDGGSSGGSGSKKSKSKEPLSRVAITLRFPRNPIIGDKFSSRHGQKGVMSILFPQQDMPFTESGMSPDIIINPHAFPSRMTIGMLLESMAGKSGAMSGHYQDGTPFSFNEEHTAVDYFGEQLVKQGYSYYGSEPMYSGVSGTVMHADIYIGVVYYQRLRHMVSDKSQVRAIGPINSLTRQPIKGRKRHGGIRLGEMERDALLAHGSSFLLLDRLFNCSDKHVAYVCTNPKCGSLLAPTHTFNAGVGGGGGRGGSDDEAGGGFVCRVCKRPENPTAPDAAAFPCEPIALPYVFRYLTNELAGMNIRMTLKMDGWKA